MHDQGHRRDPADGKQTGQTDTVKKARVEPQQAQQPGTWRESACSFPYLLQMNVDVKHS